MRGLVRGTEIIHIGKEANNIDGELLDGGNVQVFRNIERETQRVLLMRQCDAEKMGVNREKRWRILKKYKSGYVN